MTTETFTKISRLYDHDADISNEEAKKTIARAIKPDKKLNFLPALKTTPKRILLITPPGHPNESFGRLSGATGELLMLGLELIFWDLIQIKKYGTRTQTFRPATNSNPKTSRLAFFALSGNESI